MTPDSTSLSSNSELYSSASLLTRSSNNVVAATASALPPVNSLHALQQAVSTTVRTTKTDGGRGGKGDKVSSSSITQEEKLRELCCFGDHKGVKELLKSYRVNVNSGNRVNGWTPLHWAAKAGSSQIVDLLIQKGADPSIVSSDGMLPINLATSVEVYQTLLKNTPQRDLNGAHQRHKSSLPLLPLALQSTSVPNTANSAAAAASVAVAATLPSSGPLGLSLSSLNFTEAENSCEVNSKLSKKHSLKKSNYPTTITGEDSQRIASASASTISMPGSNSGGVGAATSSTSLLSANIPIFRRRRSSGGSTSQSPLTSSVDDNSAAAAFPTQINSRFISNGYTSSANTLRLGDAKRNLSNENYALHKRVHSNPYVPLASSEQQEITPPTPATSDSSHFWSSSQTQLLQSPNSFEFNNRPLYRIIKVRIAGKDPDFVEIDLPMDKLTLRGLIEVACLEMFEKFPVHVERVRKLPNTRLRRDIEIERLENYAEIELVLANPSSPSAQMNSTGSSHDSQLPHSNRATKTNSSSEHSSSEFQC